MRDTYEELYENSIPGKLVPGAVVQKLNSATQVIILIQRIKSIQSLWSGLGRITYPPYIQTNSAKGGFTRCYLTHKTESHRIKYVSKGRFTLANFKAILQAILQAILPRYRHKITALLNMFEISLRFGGDMNVSP